MNTSIERNFSRWRVFNARIEEVEPSWLIRDFKTRGEEGESRAQGKRQKKEGEEREEMTDRGNEKRLIGEA